MFKRNKVLLADPEEIRETLSLPTSVSLDSSLDDLILEIGDKDAGCLFLNGRPLPAGRRVLLEGEELRHGRRRIIIAGKRDAEMSDLRPRNPSPSGQPPDFATGRGTRAIGLAAFASPLAIPINTGPCLVILEGEAAGRRWPLTQGSQIVGRGVDADIVIPHSTVSRRHARIRADKETISMEDLGSRHGVRAEKRLLKSERVLRRDIEVVLGMARVKILLGSKPGPPEQAPHDPRSFSGDRDGLGKRDHFYTVAALALLMLGSVVSTLSLAS